MAAGPHDRTEQRRRLRLAVAAAGEEALRRRTLVRIVACFIPALALLGLGLWLLASQ